MILQILVTLYITMIQMWQISQTGWLAVEKLERQFTKESFMRDVKDGLIKALSNTILFKSKRRRDSVLDFVVMQKSLKGYIFIFTFLIRLKLLDSEMCQDKGQEFAKFVKQLALVFDWVDGSPTCIIVNEDSTASLTKVRVGLDGSKQV